MRAIHKKRLLNVARALRESKEPDKFTMDVFGHECGTPACALGHYASRRDLQDAFSLRALPGRTYSSLFLRGGRSTIGYDYPEVARHFGVSKDEAKELFGFEGCGNAFTATNAAAYIERFVARKAKAAAK